MLTPKQREDFEVLTEGISTLHGYAQTVKRRLDDGAVHWQHPELSAKLRERLDQIGKQLSDLVALADQIERQMDELDRELYWKHPPQTKNSLSDDEVAGLLRLNRRLSDLERYLQNAAQDLTPRLEAKLADSNDGMADYEIEATLHFVLREDDPEFDDSEDNFLTVRKEDLKRIYRLADDKDHRDLPMRQLKGERHCWLFHDLYDHSYGLRAPRVPLCECLRIGTAWVDIVIRQQYWLNIDTGKWISFSK